MAIDTAPAQEQAQAGARTARSQPWVALGLTLFSAASYLVALVLPYYANDLHRRPEGESLYLHEMSGLWPYDTSLGWLVSLLALFSFAAAPFASVGVATWAAYRLWADRRAPRLRVVWLAALVIAVATVAWMFTPLAEELRVWLVD